MEWNVKNAINRDVERQHLNKILKEIKSSMELIEQTSSGAGSVQEQVGSMVEGNRESGIEVTYDPSRGVLDFAVAALTVRMVGDVTAQATVNGLGTMTLNTSIDPSVRGVEEAPLDGQTYWRRQGQWSQVPDSVASFDFIEGSGILVLDVNGEFGARAIEGTAGEIGVENGDGTAGNPVLSLADVPNSGEGQSPLKIYTRDDKGRITGDESASTDDLPEGSGNLYHTEERAQEAVGGILEDTADILMSYTPGSITSELSPDVHASLELADNALQPGDNISELVNDTGYAVLEDIQDSLDLAGTSLQPGDDLSILENDVGYITQEDIQDSLDLADSSVQTIQPGENVVVDDSDPASPVVGLLPLASLVDAVDDAAADAGGVEVGGLYRNGSVLMIRVS